MGWGEPHTPRAIPLEVAASEHLDRVTAQRDRLLDFIEKRLARTHDQGQIGCVDCELIALGAEIRGEIEL